MVMQIKILGKKFCVTYIQENPLFLSALDYLVEKKASATMKMSRTLSRYIPLKRGLPSVNNIKVHR